MDGRVLIKGAYYGRKLPGGYFRFPGEQEDTRPVDASKRWISYAGWNTKFSSPIPLPMQRAIVDQYINKHGVKINDYQFENEFLDWLPGLEKYITGYNIDAIVMCSIFNLPDNPFRRYQLLKLAVDSGVELHFANELTSLKTKADLEKIETYLNFAVAKSGPYVWE